MNMKTCALTSLLVIFSGSYCQGSHPIYVQSQKQQEQNKNLQQDFKVQTEQSVCVKISKLTDVTRTWVTKKIFVFATD